MVELLGGQFPFHFGGGFTLKLLRLAKRLVRAGCLSSGDDPVDGPRYRTPMEADAVRGGLDPQGEIRVAVVRVGANQKFAGATHAISIGVERQRRGAAVLERVESARHLPAVR